MKATTMQPRRVYFAYVSTHVTPRCVRSVVPPLGISSPSNHGPLSAKVAIILSKSKLYSHHNFNPVYWCIPVYTGDCSLTSTQTYTNEAPYTDFELTLIVHVYILQASVRLEFSPNGQKKHVWNPHSAIESQHKYE